MKLTSPLPAHPRLLLRQDDWPRLRHKIATDGPSAAIYATLLARADAILTEPPVGRDLIGRMLLMISRQALERISVLAMVAGVSGDDRYGARAIAEMLAICRFSDWNPSHFLDTAELCLAVSIGYDWLHHQLSPVEREEIGGAIATKGIAPSLDTTARHNWWLTTEENWAQVCHGGLGAAAIALADRNPAQAEFLLTRALQAIPAVAASYAPDGAYPEGPMYWSYGTGYHVVLAAALECLTGSAQGLDAFPGFAESAAYINAVTAPSGEYFNYADCAAQRRIQAQLFWMARRWDRPDWLAHDLMTLERDLAEYRADPAAQYWYYDIVALALLWRTPTRSETAAPARCWSADGKMPVAIYRWGADKFLGIKGGAVGLSHSHMDVGSFVYESQGVRWAVDLGMQDYASLEEAGVDLWNEREQGSERWTIFRIGPDSHNILRFGDRPQRLLQHAAIKADASQCLVDLSAVYSDPLVKATRQFQLEEEGFALTDAWSARASVNCSAQWLTFAEIETRDGGLLLSQGGKRLRLRMGDGMRAEVQQMDEPIRGFDAANPNLKRIVIRSAGSLSGSVRLQVSDD
ncbi:MAG: heparinase II/III family protein [Devosia sp.]|uniref:heparinase II/III domain-containing protein n=1 Tax=Devosia sp. 66-22 TaxID=1895753 RepID=UPI0009291437|nr:heparinase II/III family protein [Devosia sp. 66-22]MBN9347923.1 heparinase II/III family protein [Devosia sp.]OJX50073.1 MAG: hypothetical protein BGO81_05310 [Devosia sp. 66-22]